MQPTFHHQRQEVPVSQCQSRSRYRLTHRFGTWKIFCSVHTMQTSLPCTLVSNSQALGMLQLTHPCERATIWSYSPFSREKWRWTQRFFLNLLFHTRRPQVYASNLGDLFAEAERLYFTELWWLQRSSRQVLWLLTLPPAAGQRCCSFKWKVGELEKTLPAVLTQIC